MSEVYEFTSVNAFAEDPARQIVSFSTEAGKNVSIQDEGPGKLDIQFVRRALVEHKVVFVAYDPDTGFSHFTVPFNEDYVDSIEFVGEPKPGLKVRLVRRPSFLYLLSTHPRFEVLRKILENANKTRQLVWVGTFPGDGEILDVSQPTRQ